LDVLAYGMARFLSIVLICIVTSILYGLIHDQITVRISLEYFTVLHPKILPDDTSPTLLALVWGVIATWWVGLILGIILGLACCLGKRPKLSALDLIRPILWLLLIMGLGAALAGFTGYILTTYNLIVPSPEIMEMVPQDKVLGIMIDGFSHDASYGIGFIGGVVLSVWAWFRRDKLENKTN
jgi:hypothetical protein